jgi:type VI protein secretion system component Hcp
MSEKENVAVNRDADTRVLRDDELDCVSGGRAKHGEIVVVKELDKASPVLF